LRGRFAWCITGSGDAIEEILDSMIRFKDSHSDIDIRVFLSKSAEQVLTWYKLLEKIKSSFKVKMESSPNTPFLAGEVQSGKYDFILVAPTSSNSTTKIALGIGDSLITNSVNMAVKASVPVYIYPCEIGEDEKVTLLPNGSELKLTIREIDAMYIESLERDPGIHVLRDIEEIKHTLSKYYSEV
jgi:archaeoflavoprotein AfpA